MLSAHSSLEEGLALQEGGMADLSLCSHCRCPRSSENLLRLCGVSVGLWKERIKSSPGTGVFLLEIAFPLAPFANVSITTAV